MIINGKYMSEPEAQAYISKLQTELGAAEDYIESRNERIAELEAANKRYEEGIETLGKDFNMEVSTVGFLEEKNAELEEQAKRMKEILRDALIDLHMARHCTSCEYDKDKYPAQCNGCVGQRYKYRHYAEIIQLVGGLTSDD